MASSEMIKIVRKFKLWRAQFCCSPKGKRAMDKMKSLPRGENEFPYGNLESSVLQVCFQASKFVPEKIAYMPCSRLKKAKKIVPAGKKSHPTVRVFNGVLKRLLARFRFLAGFIRHIKSTPHQKTFLNNIRDANSQV